MNTYTFCYFESVDDFSSLKPTEITFTASRLSVACKAFYDFVLKSNFDYFTFTNVYKVTGRCSTSFRILPSKYYYDLDSLKRAPSDG